MTNDNASASVVSSEDVPHTPGPWVANVGTAFIDVRAQKEDPPVVGWQGFDECFRSKVEHIANARLIAAAPTLLAAAEAAVSLATSALESGMRFGPDTMTLEQIVESLTAAIAEARGGEQ